MPNYYHFPGAKPADENSVELPAGGRALEVPAGGAVVALTPGYWDLKHTGKYINAGTETDTTARLYYARGTTAPVLAVSQGMSIGSTDAPDIIHYDPLRDASNVLYLRPASGAIAIVLKPLGV